MSVGEHTKMKNKQIWPSLEMLIGELPAENFFSEVWEKKHLLVRASSNAQFTDILDRLFSFEHADQLLSVSGPRFRNFIRMTKDGRPIPNDQFSMEREDGLETYKPGKIIQLYREGATITVNRAHQCSTELARLCGDLSRELKAHVNANVYITPPQSQGFAVHSDTHDVFLVQINGTKRWKVQKNLEYLSTTRNHNVKSDPVSERRWDTFSLTRGDIIYIPRGLLHEGMSQDTHSLHITLGIHSTTWADLTRRVLNKVEFRESIFRQSIRPDVEIPESTIRQLISILSSGLRNSKIIREVIDDDRKRNDTVSVRGCFLKASEKPTIGMKTRIGPVRNDIPDIVLLDEKCVLYFGEKVLTFPNFASLHLRAILQNTSVTVDDLPGGLDDEGKLTLVRCLFAHGVLKICDEL